MGEGRGEMISVYKKTIFDINTLFYACSRHRLLLDNLFVYIKKVHCKYFYRFTELYYKDFIAV